MDTAHDKLYGRIADLLAQEAQKRNGNLVEFPAEVLQVARQILLAEKRGRCILEYLVTQLSFHYYMIPYIIKAIQQKNCGVLSGFI